MNRPTAFNTIFRRATPAEIASPPAGKYLQLYDPAAQRFVAKKGWFGEVSGFLFSLDTPVNHHCPGFILRSEGPAFDEVELNVWLELTCPSGHEEGITKAFLHQPHPEQAIDSYVVNCLEQLRKHGSKEDKNVVVDFLTHRAGWENQIAAWLLQQFHLRVVVHLELTDIKEARMPATHQSDWHPINFRGSDTKIPVKYSWELGVIKGQEHLALIRHRRLPALTNQMVDILTEWLFVNGSPANLAIDLDSLRTKLRAELATAAAPFGRQLLQFKFDAKPETFEERVTIDLDWFQVHVNDADLELKCKCKFELLPDQNAIERAYDRQGNMHSLQTDLRRSIESQLLEQFTFAKFCRSTEEVKKDLRDKLSEICARYGRKLSSFTLEKQHWQPPQFDVLAIPQSHTVGDGNQRINVEHRVLFELADIRTFSQANITNVQDWARDQLQRITQEVIFKSTFSQVVANFDDDISGSIKNQMSESAALIGLRVKQYSTLSDVLGITGTLRFDFTKEFETADQVPVSIKIAFRGRLKKFDAIKHHLTPNVNLVEGVIVPHIKEAVSYEMYKVSTASFQKHFVDKDRDQEPGVVDGSLANALPIERRLRTAISDALEEYDVEWNDLTISPVRNAIIIRHDELIARSVDFGVVVKPTGGEKLTYTGSLRVKEVRNWEKFLRMQRQCPNTEAHWNSIKKLAEDTIRDKVDFVMNPAEAQFGSASGRQQLVNELSIAITQKVLDAHGVDLDLQNFTREGTEVDDILYQKRKQHFIDNLDDELTRQQRLRKRLEILQDAYDKLLLAGDFEDDRLNMIQSQINSVDAELADSIGKTKQTVAAPHVSAPSAPLIQAPETRLNLPDKS